MLNYLLVLHGLSKQKILWERIKFLISGFLYQQFFNDVVKITNKHDKYYKSKTTA